MTSVSGHLLQHDFPPSYKNWNETPIKVLFDVPVLKNVIPGMEDIKATLVEEVRRSDVSFVLLVIVKSKEGKVNAFFQNFLLEINHQLSKFCNNSFKKLNLFFRVFVAL